MKKAKKKLTSNDIHNKVVEKILALLDQGEIPWQKPWTCYATNSPKNLVSKKPYRGINSLLTGFAGFNSPWWVSYKQAMDLGGNVRKGEHGTLIVFWKQIKVKKTEAEMEKDPDGPRSKMIPLLRYSHIFNISQCDGLEEVIAKAEGRDITPCPPLCRCWNCRMKVGEEWAKVQGRVECCESVIKEMPQAPVIAFGGGEAFYSPRQDRVQMPEYNTFKTPEGYYSTIFHELGHSTGHSKRLARKEVMDSTSFGSHSYSKEELVAEFTASFLCGTCNISNEKTLTNSAAYIRSWKRKLSNDPNIFISAVGKAQKAADYILRSTQEEEKPEEETA